MRGVVVLLALSACARFDVVTANECGNGILEDGEDCDRLVDPGEDGLTCAACRWECEPTDVVPTCPGGWGCGLDHVCRHATGDLEDAAGALDVEVTDYIVEDLDGDLLPDALGYGPTSIWLARGKPGLQFELVDRYARTRADVRPAFGDVDGAAFNGGFRTTDLATSPGTRAVAYWTVSGGRLRPSPQPWYRLAQTSFAAVAVRTSAASPARDLAALSFDGASLSIRVDRPDAPGEPLVFGGKTSSCATGTAHLTAADLDGDDVDEIVLACGGSPTIEVFQTSLDGDGDPIVTSLVSVTMPEPAGGRVVIADHDSDGRLDLLIPVAGEFGGPFVVLPQTSSLTFGAPTIDDRLTPQPLLAAADLDDDGALDLISNIAVYLDRGGALVQAAAAMPLWADATVADLNRDGVLDVVATGTGRLDTLLGSASSTFALHVALVDGQPDALTVGDLDGDGFPDVATHWTDDDDGAVELLYGHPDGLFDTTVSAGAYAFTPIVFEATQFVDDGSLFRADSAAELIVSSSREVLVFSGSGVRPPVAPLDVLDDPRALALGDFDPSAISDDTGTDDLIVLTADPDRGTIVYAGVDLDEVYRVPMTSGCPVSPAVVATGSVIGTDVDDVVELSCRVPGTAPITQYFQNTVAHDDPRLTQSFGSQLDVGGDGRALVLADLDRDGHDEAMFSVDGGIAGLIGNDGDLVGLEVVEIPHIDDIDGLTVGNLDLDPELELVIGGTRLLAYDYVRSDNNVNVSAMLQPGTEEPWMYDADGIPRLADCDRDGVVDLVLGGDQLRVHRAITHTD